MMTPPGCLYAETAATPAISAPPLQGDIHCDTVIVGGGFTGLSAALHLAEAGQDVVVVDSHAPGWGASGRNGGQINPGLKPTPLEVEREYGPLYGPRLARSTWRAPDLVFSLIEKHGIACDAVRGGTIRAATAENQIEPLRSLLDECAALGNPVEWLDQAAMTQRTGSPGYVGGMLDRCGGQLNPLGYARGLANAAERHGARIFSKTRAMSWRREDDRWSLHTSGGIISARMILFATNGYTDGLNNRLRRSVVPAFSSIVATDPLPIALRRQILAESEVVYELGQITTYYRIDAQGRLLIGGRSAQHPATGPLAFPFLVRRALKLWPFLADIGWTHGWNGQVCMTLDHLPHWHEPEPGLVAGLGYNGRGVAMATMMGRELARRAMGVPVEELLFPARPIEPVPMHRFWRLGAEAAIVSGRVKDALGIG